MKAPWWLVKYIELWGGATEEMESVIATDCTAAMEYNDRVRGGEPWPEAELAISKVPNSAVWYARYVLRDPYCATWGERYQEEHGVS